MIPRITRRTCIIEVNPQNGKRRISYSSQHHCDEVSLDLKSGVMNDENPGLLILEKVQPTSFSLTLIIPVYAKNIADS